MMKVAQQPLPWIRPAPQEEPFLPVNGILGVNVLTLSVRYRQGDLPTEVVKLGRIVQSNRCPTKKFHLE
jgi:hypothetical protein